MSAVIKGSCPICGDVELTPRDITLNVTVCTPERDHYCFTCPRCHDRVEKHADANVIALLAHAGIVNKTPWEPPVHPENPPADAPRLTEDDLIVFGLLLEGACEPAAWALPRDLTELARWAR